MSLYRSAGWSALPRSGLSLPQPHLRLPGHQSARLGLRPAPARALGGDGPVQERHGRPGQERHPQLQSQGHRQQDGEKNFSSFFRITRLKCQCGTYIFISILSSISHKTPNRVITVRPERGLSRQR